jgi:CxxC-x17-CxxC domain-containing protein
MTYPTTMTQTNTTRTTVTCTRCQKETTVPFVPTPGRPVFCRDCFAKTPASGPRPPPRSFGAARGPRTPVDGERKRMMAQGRKTHFIYDARAILTGMEGGMEDKDNRAFLEGLFARGARISTQAAQEFLEEKVNDGAVTHEQAIQLGRLIDKYSFFR